MNARKSAYFIMACAAALTLLWSIEASAWDDASGGDHQGQDWILEGATYNASRPISGTHSNINRFIVMPDAHVYIKPHVDGAAYGEGFGYLEVHAKEIYVYGIIDGNAAGYAGGAGGAGGTRGYTNHASQGGGGGAVGNYFSLMQCSQTGLVCSATSQCPFNGAGEVCTNVGSFSAGYGGAEGGDGQYRQRKCGGFFCIGNKDGAYAGGGGGGAASGGGNSTNGCVTTGKGITGQSGWANGTLYAGGAGGAGQSDTSYSKMFGPANCTSNGCAAWTSAGMGGGGAGGGGGSYYNGYNGSRGGAGGAKIILDAKEVPDEYGNLSGGILKITTGELVNINSTNYYSNGRILMNGGNGGPGGDGRQTGGISRDGCSICCNIFNEVFGFNSKGCVGYYASGSGGGGGGGAGGTALISGKNVTIHNYTNTDPLFFATGGAGGAGGYTPYNFQTAGAGARGGAGRVLVYSYPSAAGGTIACQGGASCPAWMLSSGGCNDAQGTIWSGGVMMQIKITIVNIDCQDPMVPCDTMFSGEAYPRIPLWLDGWQYYQPQDGSGFITYVVPYTAHRTEMKKYSQDAYTRYEFISWDKPVYDTKFITYASFSPDTADRRELQAKVVPDKPYIWNGRFSSNWNNPLNWNYKDRLVCASQTCTGSLLPPHCCDNPTENNPLAECLACGIPSTVRNIVIQDVYDNNRSNYMTKAMNDLEHPKAFSNVSPTPRDAITVKIEDNTIPKHTNFQAVYSGFPAQFNADCNWTANAKTKADGSINLDAFSTCNPGVLINMEGSSAVYYWYNPGGNQCNGTNYCQFFQGLYRCGGCTSWYYGSDNNEICSVWSRGDCKCDDIFKYGKPGFRQDFSACTYMYPNGQELQRAFMHEEGSVFPLITQEDGVANGKSIVIRPHACINFKRDPNPNYNARLIASNDVIVYGKLGNTSENCLAPEYGLWFNGPRPTVPANTSYPFIEIGGNLQVLGLNKPDETPMYVTDPKNPPTQIWNPAYDADISGEVHLEGYKVTIGEGLYVDGCGKLTQILLADGRFLDSSFTFNGPLDGTIKVMEPAIAGSDAYSIMIHRVIVAKDEIYNPINHQWSRGSLSLVDAELGSNPNAPKNSIEYLEIRSGVVNPKGRSLYIDQKITVGNPSGYLVLDDSLSQVYVPASLTVAPPMFEILDGGNVIVKAGNLNIIKPGAGSMDPQNVFVMRGGYLEVSNGGKMNITNADPVYLWDAKMLGGRIALAEDGQLNVDNSFNLAGGSLSFDGGFLNIGTDSMNGGDLRVSCRTVCSNDNSRSCGNDNECVGVGARCNAYNCDTKPSLVTASRCIGTRMIAIGVYAPYTGDLCAEDTDCPNYLFINSTCQQMTKPALMTINVSRNAEFLGGAFSSSVAPKLAMNATNATKSGKVYVSIPRPEDDPSRAGEIITLGSLTVTEGLGKTVDVQFSASDSTSLHNLFIIDDVTVGAGNTINFHNTQLYLNADQNPAVMKPTQFNVEPGAKAFFIGTCNTDVSGNKIPNGLVTGPLDAAPDGKYRDADPIENPDAYWPSDIRYRFVVKGNADPVTKKGGTLGAVCYTFENMHFGGLTIEEYGHIAQSDPVEWPYEPFENCKFRHPDIWTLEGGALLRINTDEILTLNKTSFALAISNSSGQPYLPCYELDPSNPNSPAGCKIAANIAKSVHKGSVTVTKGSNVENDLFGEEYDLEQEWWQDPYGAMHLAVWDNIHWPATLPFISPDGHELVVTSVDDMPLNSRMGHMKFSFPTGSNSVSTAYCIRSTRNTAPALVQYVDENNIPQTTAGCTAWKTTTEWGQGGSDIYVPDGATYSYAIAAKNRIYYELEGAECSTKADCYTSSQCIAGETCFCELSTCKALTCPKICKRLLGEIPADGTEFTTNSPAKPTLDRTPPDVPEDLIVDKVDDPPPPAPLEDRHAVISFTPNTEFFYMNRIPNVPGGSPLPVGGIYDLFDAGSGSSPDPAKWSVASGNWVEISGEAWQINASADAYMFITNSALVDPLDMGSITTLQFRKTINDDPATNKFYGGPAVIFRMGGKYVKWEVGKYLAPTPPATEGTYVSRVIGIDSCADFIAHPEYHNKKFAPAAFVPYNLRVSVMKDPLSGLYTAFGYINEIVYFKYSCAAAEIDNAYPNFGLGSLSGKIAFDEYRVNSLYYYEYINTATTVDDFDARDLAPPDIGGLANKLSDFFTPQDVSSLSTTEVKIKWNGNVFDNGTTYYYYVVGLDLNGNYSNMLRNEGLEARNVNYWTDEPPYPSYIDNALYLSQENPQTGYMSLTYNLTHIDGNIDPIRYMKGQTVSIPAGTQYAAYHFSRWAYMSEWTQSYFMPAILHGDYSSGSNVEVYSDIIYFINSRYQNFHVGFSVPSSQTVTSLFVTSEAGDNPTYKVHVDKGELQRMSKVSVISDPECVLVQYNLNPHLGYPWEILGKVNLNPAKEGTVGGYPLLTPNTKRYYGLSVCDHHADCSLPIPNLANCTPLYGTDVDHIRWTWALPVSGITVSWSVDANPQTLALFLTAVTSTPPIMNNPADTKYAIGACEGTCAGGTPTMWIKNDNTLTTLTGADLYSIAAGEPNAGQVVPVNESVWQTSPNGDLAFSVMGLDPHKTYCFKALAKNGDTPPVYTVYSSESCKRPLGKPRLLDAKVTKGDVDNPQLDKRQPPVKVDGKDKQNIIVEVMDPNGYEDINWVGVRICKDGTLDATGTDCAENPRGWLEWYRTETGACASGCFNQRTGVNGGQTITLVQPQTNPACPDCSSVTVEDQDTLKIVFAYTLNPNAPNNYGDAQANGAAISVTDKDYDSTCGTVCCDMACTVTACCDESIAVSWTDGRKPFNFHVSSLPPTPSNYTFNGMDPLAFEAGGGWTTDNTPVLTAKTLASDPNADDIVKMRFRLSTSPDCQVDFEGDRDLEIAIGADQEKIARYEPTVPLPDGQYWWCALSTDQHNYTFPIPQSVYTPWFADCLDASGLPTFCTSMPNSFKLDTTGPRIDEPILACANSTNCTAANQLPAEGTDSKTIYFEWSAYRNVGAGPHSDFDKYYIGWGTDLASADPKDGNHKYAINDHFYYDDPDNLSMPYHMIRGRNVYFCVRGRDVLGNWGWTVRADGTEVDEPTCKILNLEKYNPKQLFVKSDTHPYRTNPDSTPNDRIVYCDIPSMATDTDAYNPNAYDAHLCFDTVNDNICHDEASAAPDCELGVEGVSFLMAKSQTEADIGTPTQPTKWESWDNSCDKEKRSCIDSQRYVGDGKTYYYTFTYTQTTGTPSNERDIKYFLKGSPAPGSAMDLYAGTWYFGVRYKCTYGTLPTPTKYFRLNICACEPKDSCQSPPPSVASLPAGTFNYGGKTHEMTPYFLSSKEISNAKYLRCVKDGACPSLPAEKKISLTRFDYMDNAQYADYPVVNVSWDAASAYCAWETKGSGRLPTELEMAYAASYFYGKFFSDKEFIVNDQAKVGDTIDVSGEYGPGVGEILNLLNNVSEWTSGWAAPEGFSGDTVEQCMSACAFAGTFKKKEDCASSCHKKVAFGGSFENAVITLFERKAFAPGFSDVSLGFRCMMPNLGAYSSETIDNLQTPATLDKQKQTVPSQETKDKEIKEVEKKDVGKKGALGLKK